MSEESKSSPDVSGFAPTQPDWIHQVAVPTWVSGRDGCMHLLNAAAEQLLQRPMSECRGRPCHESVRGTDEDGSVFCRRSCPIRKRAEARTALPDLTLEVGGRGARRRLDLVFVPLWPKGDSRPWIVHFGLHRPRNRRALAYLARVAERDGMRPNERAHGECYELLTAREREILCLLSEDRDPKQIARLLHVSHATVRNHVQHILNKLGAHSIPEAVARDLLLRDTADDSA